MVQECKAVVHQTNARVHQRNAKVHQCNAGALVHQSWWREIWTTDGSDACCCKGGVVATKAVKILALPRLAWPPPLTPILALWWIWRQTRVNAIRDILTTKVRKWPFLGVNGYFLKWRIVSSITSKGSANENRLDKWSRNWQFNQSLKLCPT